MSGVSGTASQVEIRHQSMLKIQPLLDELAILALSPRHRLNALQKHQVPETPGLYVLYEEEPLDILYVGQSYNLRFRIMENHLCKRGQSTFVKSVHEHYAFADRAKACDHIRQRCSVSWMEISDARELYLLEHLAIGVMQPRLNRG